MAPPAHVWRVRIWTAFELLAPSPNPHTHVIAGLLSHLCVGLVAGIRDRKLTDARVMVIHRRVHDVRRQDLPAARRARSGTVGAAHHSDSSSACSGHLQHAQVRTSR